MATRSSILARRIPKDRGAWWVINLRAVYINIKYMTSSNSLFNLFALKEKSPDSIQMTGILPPVEGTSPQPICFLPRLVPFSMSATNLLEKTMTENENSTPPMEPGNI